MTKRKEVVIGHRFLKPGDRVVQSRSIHFWDPVCDYFPWEVVSTSCAGQMARVRYVGECGTLNEGETSMSTKYLVSKWCYENNKYPSVS